MPIKDITGLKSGKLTAVRIVGRTPHYNTIWECLCECGRTTKVSSGKLVKGTTKSCGCLKPGNTKTLIGRRFTRLLVVSTAKSYKGRRQWRCLCDCGETLIVCTDFLISGHTKSCGCYRCDVSREVNTTHGGASSPLYPLWLRIKARCNYKNYKGYRFWGGRGIKVCVNWENDFAAFKKYIETNLGECPKNHSLDRINNNKGYEPGNIRWATSGIQTHNRNARHWKKYKGTSFDKKTSKFKSKITKDRESYHLGYFKTELEAAKAYDKKALELYGPTANINKYDE